MCICTVCPCRLRQRQRPASAFALAALEWFAAEAPRLHAVTGVHTFASLYINEITCALVFMSVDQGFAPVWTGTNEGLEGLRLLARSLTCPGIDSPVGPCTFLASLQLFNVVQRHANETRMNDMRMRAPICTRMQARQRLYSRVRCQRRRLDLRSAQEWGWGYKSPKSQ
ncbi:BQ5605_C015g07806 [Microbotryum silenes-dioicae]|uniref:BQ5605_C015g07806 protein n=1 Tax=Microbotryum silenes-dioicae TaxID=796604 RepID=A0A2X0NXA1_9BASI|nr:BQ5605_C015g07806 [Microbotryum silenes-dioicae]